MRREMKNEREKRNQEEKKWRLCVPYRGYLSPYRDSVGVAVDCPTEETAISPSLEESVKEREKSQNSSNGSEKISSHHFSLSFSLISLFPHPL